MNQVRHLWLSYSPAGSDPSFVPQAIRQKLDTLSLCEGKRWNVLRHGAFLFGWLGEFSGCEEIENICDKNLMLCAGDLVGLNEHILDQPAGLTDRKSVV